MKINLRIDRLVLDGVSVAPYERRNFTAALESSLRREIARQGVAARHLESSARASVSAGPIDVSGMSRPATLAKQLGRAVVTGINK